MANINNLQNIGDLPIKQRRAMQSAGGKAGLGSPAKSLAKRLYWLKRKGLTDENCDRIHEIMIHPDLSALDSRMLLENLRNKVKTPEQKMKLAQLFLNWHKVHHGEKSLNLNIDVSSEIKSLREFLTGEDENTER
jgi:hypothetical protein